MYKKSKPLDELSLVDGIDLFIKEQKNAITAIKNNDSIVEAINKIYNHLVNDEKSRLIYVGAGTSGRIGVQDAQNFSQLSIGLKTELNL